MLDFGDGNWVSTLRACLGAGATLSPYPAFWNHDVPS